MKIFHIATAADWAAATRAGEYRISTRGRTLDDEGFIHAAYREQVGDVYDEFYADVTEPLVLLHIEPSRLTSELREDRVGDRVFPHVYGPLNRQAVVDAQPLDATGRPVTFFRLMLREMAWRMAAGLLFMLFVTIGILVASGSDQAWPSVLGVLVGASLGVISWRILSRRFG
ncbi:MAG: DUF952 domain-containing protein [Myxococcales bacterium]|nr:MAG: DUF952 domain-containing protein [Myxococcales bacterium]